MSTLGDKLHWYSVARLLQKGRKFSYYRQTVPSCCDDSSKVCGELPSGSKHEFCRCFDTEDARRHFRRWT